MEPSPSSQHQLTPVTAETKDEVTVTRIIKIYKKITTDL